MKRTIWRAGLCGLLALLLLPSHGSAARGDARLHEEAQTGAASQQIAYISGGRLWLEAIDGTGAREIPTPWPVAGFQWSPDGSLLVVEDAASRLTLVDAATGAAQILAQTSGEACCPDPPHHYVWSPNSRYLTFVTGTTASNPPSAQHSAILRLWDRSTRGIRVLAREPEVELASPVAWSHDSTRLAVAKGGGFAPFFPQYDNPTLDVIDIASGTVQHIDKGTVPTWSPDDRLLSYVQVGGCGASSCSYSQLVRSVNGGTPVYLDTHQDYLVNNIWIPRAGGYIFDRWLLNSDGHIVRQVAGDEERVLAWSPDGGEALVQSIHPYAPNPIRLRLVSAAGMSVDVYATTQPTCQCGDLRNDVYAVAWEESSHVFAFACPNYCDPPGIFTYSFATGPAPGTLTPVRLTTDAPIRALASTVGDIYLLILAGQSLYRYSTATSLSSVIASGVDAFAAQPVAHTTNPSPTGSLALQWVGAGKGIASVRLIDVTHEAHGAITARIAITNNKAIFYNMSFDGTRGLTLTVHGRDVLAALRAAARKYHVAHALFPIASNSTMTTGRIPFPPGARLVVSLSKTGGDPQNAVALFTLDLGAMIAKVGGGFDVGTAVSGDADAATAFAAHVLTALDNAGFNLAAFTTQLARGDYVGALEALAATMEHAPAAFAALLHVSVPELKAVAGKMGAILTLGELAPFVYDLAAAPHSGGFVIDNTQLPPSRQTAPSGSLPRRTLGLFASPAHERHA